MRLSSASRWRQTSFCRRFHRPFDVDNYNPIFIVNPCERLVELPTPAEALSTSLPARLLPSGVSEEELVNYLANRGEFLREMIALDFRHNCGIVPPQPVAKPVQPRLVTAPVPPTPEPAKEIEIDKESLLTFAINWIASRTGFPASVIAPDSRLRDDLNLDSIKVGELVLLMVKRANRTLKGDPGVLANESLSRLIDTILGQDSRDRPPGDAANSRQIQLPSVPGLAEWVHTFHVASASPIGMEPPKPLTGPPHAPVLMAHVSSDLAELLANVPHAFVMVEHEIVTAREDLAEVTRDEFAALQQTIAPARQTSSLANLIRPVAL